MPRRQPPLIDCVLGRLRASISGTQLLRGYLWWGLAIRGMLFAAVGSLFLVDSSALVRTLMDWSLAARVPFLPPEGVKGLSVFAHCALALMLAGGAGARWVLLRRLENREDPGARSAHASGPLPTASGLICSPGVAGASRIDRLIHWFRTAERPGP